MHLLLRKTLGHFPRCLTVGRHRNIIRSPKHRQLHNSLLFLDLGQHQHHLVSKCLLVLPNPMISFRKQAESL